MLSARKAHNEQTATAVCPGSLPWITVNYLSGRKKKRVLLKLCETKGRETKHVSIGKQEGTQTHNTHYAHGQDDGSGYWGICSEEGFSLFAPCHFCHPTPARSTSTTTLGPTDTASTKSNRDGSTIIGIITVIVLLVDSTTTIGPTLCPIGRYALGGHSSTLVAVVP